MGRGEAFGLPFFVGWCAANGVREIGARGEEVVPHLWLGLKLPAANYLGSR